MTHYIEAVFNERGAKHEAEQREERENNLVV